MFNIAIAQSGGPTAAINATLAGVFARAEKTEEVDEIYGALNGIEGIINDHLINLRHIIMNEEDKDLLMKTPSTILGSCRYKLPSLEEDDLQYKTIVENLQKHHIKVFFYIGGNDSMDTVMKLDAYLKREQIDICVVGVPKTIDNDLMETDHTPGFGSAAKYVAISLQEIIRDSRVYSIPSVTIVEIMGRDAGWLAASSCVLRANGEPAPHLIYLPESTFTLEQYIQDVKNAMTRYKAVIIAVSEGVTFPDGGSEEQAKDAFGHTQNAGIGKKLEEYTAKHFQCKVRSIELNVMQRCSSHAASLTDLEESERIGGAAAEFGIEYHQSGIMAAFKRISNNPYRVEIIPCPVQDVANKEKKFPVEWISPEGNNVTVDALNYFLPLIKGEPVLKYKNGIPMHFRIDQ
ncbi:6-phosphofructokinase [Jutongia huaianensis]|jgi:6-phosphofructokinase|uniref:Pyrophosphate--fructose 6-phosphate 1-phosphotransferase n=1 Tax=Jutongia huaianensis TaxID=2763668 RepID=A0ABR7MYS1_9FIRM|nr:6-phosphofructokinase [Jutongia huaianensis]MBC8561520.1 6-phosphofructokinase [Jutongia huaianensis]OKZ82422.1 MAG: 6-phosphofructokinase [Clostridium sp. 44_14]